MIKPTPKTCNQEVQKFTNTSYDILLDIYNNTQFFKDLYASLNPSLYTDFSVGLDGWQATAGTGTLDFILDSTLSTGGDFYLDGLDIDASNNDFLSIIFSVNASTGFVGDLEITYGDTPVLYEGVIQVTGETNVANIDLEQELTHVGKITKIRFILGSSLADVFTLHKIVLTPPLVSVNNLTVLENELIQLQNTVSTVELAIENQDSRLVVLEDQPVINLDPLSLPVEEPKYIIESISVGGLDKKVVIKNDVLTLSNEDGTSFLSFDIPEDVFVYKGVIVLPDGHTIDSIDDIRALDGANGDVQEYRFIRSEELPAIDVEDPNPAGFTISPPTGTLPLWMTLSKKDAEGALLVNWSIPVQLTGEQGSAADSIFVYLTNDTFVAPSETDGDNPDLTGSGGELIITLNGTKLTSSITFLGTATKNGLRLEINPANGIYLLFDEGWTTDSEFFDLIVTYNGNNYTKRYTVSKNKQGGGAAGAGFYTITIVSNEQIGGTLQTTLNTAINSLAGRPAVQGDTLLVTWNNSTVGYVFDDPLWSVAALTINGSIIASGSIAGDKLIATALYGKRQLITSGTHVYVVDPGGVELPSNMLVWYGSTAFTAAQRTKANGIFWIDSSGKYRTYIKADKGGGNYVPTVPASAVNGPTTNITMTVKGILGKNEIRFSLEGLQIYRTPDASADNVAASLIYTLRRTSAAGPALINRSTRFVKIGETLISGVNKEFWDTPDIVLDYTEQSVVGFDANDTYVVTLVIYTSIGGGANSFDAGGTPSRKYNFSLEQWGDETEN